MPYYIRLDDACERRNVKNWDRMEKLLDRHKIAPLVGIIPRCGDPEMAAYPADESFWEKTVPCWAGKGWVLGLHGFDHVYITKEGGLNPVQKRSEFAGVPLEEQKRKIAGGVKLFREKGYEPTVFFAPSHTFDKNTLAALRECSEIRIVSDTIADRPYTRDGFTFIPQQSGVVRRLPFNTVTFCYHPNMMRDADFERLDAFLTENRALFDNFEAVQTDRKISLYDLALRKIYFLKRMLR